MEGKLLEMGKKVQVTGQVVRMNGQELRYAEFWEQFMKANKPVLLTGLMDSWRACRDWVLENGSPNLPYLATHFGTSKVQVADCGSRDFTDQKRHDMTIADFIKYWQALAPGDRHLSADRWEGGAVNLTNCLLYLKDWHFVKEYPDYHAYTTPQFFEDDWLNWYLDQYQLHGTGEENVQIGDTCSDYRFVYMGPKGTWTPLHADVLRSFSWSSNVCGRKLWHLLPAEQMPMIYDRHMRNTVYDIFGDVSPHLFPNFGKTCWVECEQGPGEVLFVPSGWFHQVTNMEDTISINHNWLNACNLHWNWELLISDYFETVKSIEDIRSIAENFEGLCQRNLAANSGMNFEDFFRFLVAVVERDLEGNEKEADSLEYVVRAQQKTFNLQQIQNILLEMWKQEYFLQQEQNQGSNNDASRNLDISAVIVIVDRALERFRTIGAHTNKLE